MGRKSTFTSIHYRDVAATLGLKLSRTAYRHPDGNAFMERMFRTLKEEAIWPNEFDTFTQARDAILVWMIDYNPSVRMLHWANAPPPRHEPKQHNT